MRLTIPCRALTCSHLQCFDATLYIQMNEKKPTWVCPVCDKKAPYEHLIIDGWVKLKSEPKWDVPVWNWVNLLISLLFGAPHVEFPCWISSGIPEQLLLQERCSFKLNLIIMRAVLSKFLSFPRCKQHMLYFLFMEQLYKSGRVDNRQSKSMVPPLWVPAQFRVQFHTRGAAIYRKWHTHWFPGSACLQNTKKKINKSLLGLGQVWVSVFAF